ncbi:hypothetical protein EGJ52_24040 [Pseudomonas luteola]|uniref:Uncharacterized protein n=1 Tax=Pseudomonas luteola TaxID=47886 RepID=A0ABS0MP95_PSELU|nr:MULTISPECIES: hypothetical protein [Pseudomonas]MBH3438550.1 hypothetical protein [Pseudomonas luteola]MDN3235542.1 hypothetical protein [Pseudomonas sp. WAC2]RRW39669.1 hypothetical protein EGJ52_24040 [Pseudomonas luteola]
MAKLISREPWWAKPPEQGQDELSLEWGYLEIYDNLEFRFVSTRPSDEEIRLRKGCRVISETPSDSS